MDESSDSFLKHVKILLVTYLKNRQVKTAKKWGKYMIRENKKNISDIRIIMNFICFEVKFSLFITVIIIIFV